MRRVVMGWGDVHHACSYLLDQMRDDHKRIRRSSIIMPVVRGGFVPAAILSYALKLNDCLSINPAIIPDRSERDDLIIVDDICDTGKTFKFFHKYFPNALYVCAFVKPEGRDHCHYFGHSYDQDQWLVFPWAPNDGVNR
jgi:hypoxanthine phosphoribosyltransferase